jgi:hypothetical protein
MSKDASFQTCGSCRKKWKHWQDFVVDPEVRILGFQGSIHLPDTNLIVFGHRCGTSISVLAKRLRHILPHKDQELMIPSLFESEICNHYCNNIENITACDRPCINARDRRLILKLMEMKKT